MKKVTAICVTRNRPRFLRRAVQLFLAQTYENKELVIIDTSKQPEDLTQPGVYHVQLPDDRTWAQAFSRGFKYAYCDYLCTWDDDDWHGPRRIEATVEALEREGAAAAGCHVRLVSLPGPRFMKWKKSQVEYWIGHADGWTYPFHDGTGLFERKWVNGLNDVTSIDIYHRIKKDGGKMVNLPNDGLFFYVRHPGVVWDFKPDELAVEEPRPDFVTDEMMAFWRDPEVLAEAGCA